MLRSKKSRSWKKIEDKFVEDDFQSVLRSLSTLMHRTFNFSHISWLQCFLSGAHHSCCCVNPVFKISIRYENRICIDTKNNRSAMFQHAHHYTAPSSITSLEVLWKRSNAESCKTREQCERDLRLAASHGTPSRSRPLATFAFFFAFFPQIFEQSRDHHRLAV